MGKTAQWMIFAAVLLLGAVILFSNLALYDIWGDEALTFPKGQSFSEVIEYTKLAGGTIHPPIYSILQFYWVRDIAGMNLADNRLLWAIFGFLTVCVLFFLGKELFDYKTALAATLLCVLSSFFMQYCRMVRYYPLTALLCLLTILFFVRFRRTGKWSDWSLFTLSSAVFLYEDYLAVFVFFFLYLYLFLNWKTYRSQIAKWLLAAGVVVLLFLPWLPNLQVQTGGALEPYPEHVGEFMEETPRMAQKAVGVRSIVLNSVLKAGFLSYTFTIGETVYPWRWWITLPLFISFALLFIHLLLKTIRGNSRNIGILMIPFLGILFATIIISEIYGPFGSRMFQFPSKVLFLLPLFLLLIARSWSMIKTVFIQVILAVVILAGNVYAFNNYSSGRQFLNPKFLSPWRQIQSDIAAQADPRDLILTDEEAFLHNLQTSDFPVEKFGLVGALEKVESTLLDRGPHRVYLVIRFRGDQTIYMEGLNVRSDLLQRYVLEDTWNYLPSDPEASPFWKRILGSEPPEFLINVFVFNIDEPSQQVENK